MSTINRIEKKRERDDGARNPTELQDEELLNEARPEGGEPLRCVICGAFGDNLHVVPVMEEDDFLRSAVKAGAVPASGLAEPEDPLGYFLSGSPVCSVCDDCLNRVREAEAARRPCLSCGAQCEEAKLFCSEGCFERFPVSRFEEPS